MRAVVALATALFAVPTLSPASSDRHSLTAAVDISWFGADSKLDSWLHGGSGKLRFDEAHDGPRINRAFVSYRGQIADTWFLHGTLNANDTIEETLDLTEAFVEWRPLPRSEWRWRGRAGFFYPRLSLENTKPGWTSPYALSASAINTWIGEELRTLGAEMRLTRDLPRLPGNQLSFDAAVFYGNDPTGALLAWRGWAAHDRQTGLLGRIPLPEVSAIEAWAPSGNPTESFEPFQEIDNRPGYYLGGEWRWHQRLLLRYTYYDNRADPEARSGDAYAWRTQFRHIGGQATLPGDLGLLAQWIKGKTVMGPDLGPWHVQDVDFDAYYLMLTRALGKHRFSVRFESFDLEPFNDPPGITNQDRGNAYAVAWLYSPLKRLQVGAEYLGIESERCRTEICFFVFRGQPRTTSERSLQVTLRWYFAGRAPGSR
mgnify:CR=1 FL=1